MKIKKINATNYKNKKSNEINFRKKTIVFTGNNGVGKTSSIDLMKYAVVGDSKKEDIKHGSDFSLVEVELDSGTNFSRFMSHSRPAKVTLNSKTVTGKALATQLKDETGVSVDAMKIVTSSEVIEGLKPDQFGAFILNYIPEELDIDIVVDFANRGMDPMAAETEDYLRNFLPEMPTKFGMSEVKEAYKEISDSKRATKKTLEQKKASSMQFEGMAPTKNMEDIDRALDEIAKKEAIELTKKKSLEAYNNAVKIRNQQNDRIKNLEKQIAAITAIRVNEAEINELKKKLDAAKKSSNEAVFVINQMNTAIKVYTQQLKNLDGSTCPLVEGMTCTMDREAIKEEIRENIVATEEGIEIQKRVCKEKECEVNELNKKLESMQKMLSEYSRKVLLMSSLEDLKKSLIAIPEKPEEEIFDYSEEKESLKKERARIFEYEQHLKFKKEIEFYEEALAIYSDLSNRLSPKGNVINEITQYYLDTVEDEINERAKNLKKDFKVKLIPEDGVKLFIEKEKTKLPYDSLSSGEKAYVLFLIMDLFNSLSGLNILLMDDLEKLDSAAFKALIDLLMTKDVQDMYDHIVISMVAHKELLDIIDKYPEIQVEKL